MADSQPNLQVMELQAIDTEFFKFQVSPWNQGDRDLKGEGVCMGMCLDWLRRIYSTTRRAKSKFGEPGRSAMFNADEEVSDLAFWKKSKVKTRFDKQVAANKIYISAKNNNVHNMFEDLLEPEVAKRLLLEVRVRFSKSPSELPSLEDSDLKAALGASLDGAASWIKERQIALFKAVLTEKKPELIAKAYSSFRTQWALQNFKKKSNYDNIHIDNFGAVRQLVQDNPLEGEFIWNTYVFPNLSTMKDRASAIMSCGKLDGPGHDIAFHCLAGGYYFYEPNFGEYHFNQAEDLKRLFCRLWNCLYLVSGYNWAFWANYINS